MDEPGRLSEARIAVLGMGLMGGSLAMAMRGRCLWLAGYDPDPSALRLSLEKQSLDMADPDPAKVLAGANLVILAAPVRAILTLVRDLPALHPGQAVVLDIGSTKAEVLCAMSGLPPRFDPVGGHPICGKAGSGMGLADASLFKGTTFVLSHLPRTSARARALAEELVAALGARPLWMDPASHDRWVAASSLVPYMVASALALATPDEVAPVIGPGFVSTSRLASSSPGMMLDALLSNRKEILLSLGRFREQLDLLEIQLSHPSPAQLDHSLEKAVARRGSLVPSARMGDEA